jgi:mRNA-degrading endonuclease YafQ of YafQ-DinJ toxin-antitoxin module
MRSVRTLPDYEAGLTKLLSCPEATAYRAEIVERLLTGQAIPQQFHDHALHGGKLKGKRSVIVGWLPLDPEEPDGEAITFLLLYQLTPEALILVDLDQHDDLYAAYRP